ncbi:MAG: hypothetical protein MAG451_01740 [Anaerolineales bacterium]|nr:hypothetical protein [Anaerolineales bacterium]
MAGVLNVSELSPDVEAGSYHRQRPQQHQVDAARHRHANGHPHQQILPQLAFLRDQDSAEERQCREGGREAVDGHEMGLLDLKHRRGAQRRRHQGHPYIVQPAGDEEQQEHRQQVKGARKRPSHQVDLTVRGLVQVFAHQPDDEDGQRAVHEEAPTRVVRIVAGVSRVEVRPD